jgi:CheY-like chemotaxis protein
VLTKATRGIAGRPSTTRRNREPANCGYDRLMILVAVDDFLFRSKIRATGKQAGVELTFVKTPAEMLDQAKALKPALVIFDLNSAAMAPIETIAAMKQDPALAAIRTMGFVSHVDVTRINAARQAGIDEVLARSAFAGNLGDILLAAAGAPPRS